MNSFQRICRSPAFLVLALILCPAVIPGGVALAAAAPKVWIVFPLLLAVAAVICSFVARSTSKAALQKKKEAENEGVVKADLDHAGIAANILAALGGKGNVQKASCCATRLRFQLKDGAKVDEKALKSAGASGVIRSTPTACSTTTNISGTVDLVGLTTGYGFYVQLRGDGVILDGQAFEGHGSGGGAVVEKDADALALG